jgi:glutamine amidotransferase
MCELFAMSSRFPTHVHVSMKLFAEHGGQSGPHKDGWGVAYYQGAEAWQTKAAESAAYSDTLAFVEANAPATNLMLSHIRLATHGTVNLQNTQPFSYPLSGKRVTFMHNGHVPKLLHSDYAQRYTPIGDTDSEAVFSMVIDKLAKLEETPTQEKFQQLESFLIELAEAGPLNLLFTDSDYLYAFSNKRTQPDGEIRAPGMHLLCRQCSATEELDLSGVSIGGDQQELVLFASVPLSQEHWRAMTPNTLYVARQGQLIRQ